MTATWIDAAITTANRFLPRLFVADEVRSATVTATSGTPAPVKNLTTYSAWTPSAYPATITADFGGSKSFDYVAAYLKSASGNYTLEYWNGSAWVAIGTTLSRTTPGCILWLFPSMSAAKVRVTCSAASDVAVIKCGLSTQIPVGIPVGYEPALFNPNEKLSTAVSVTGQILGTQVESQRIDETLNFDLLDPDWINSTYMPIRLLVREVGVFLAWNLADFASHVIYGVVVGDPKASYSQVDCMRLQLKLEGPKHVL